MIRALTIDDEQSARNLLKRLVQDNFADKLVIVGEADDVSSGIAAINEYKPDAVFLDVQMHEGTGFDLLNKLDEIHFEVIFVTAYQQYALTAFQFSAFGYLLKPIKLDDLAATVDRLAQSGSGFKFDVVNRMKILVDNHGREDETKKLVINNQQGFTVAEIGKIIRLEGDGNYTHFVFCDKPKVTTSKSLGEYEDLLSSHGFFRIHQSTIINLSHVESYSKGTGGSVKMSDGESCTVSRHRKAQFLKQFGK